MMHAATIKVLRLSYFVSVLIVCLSACTKKSSESGPVASRHFIDAFYSFNRDSLERLLMDAPESQPEILYYQKWAECASYKVLDRSHVLVKNDSLVIFPVTVKDDLMAALEIDFNVTDTFHISFRNGKIRSVKTSSNDPKLYYEAKDWVKQNRPEWVEKACEGIWEGGPTPCECVLGMIRGLKDFTDARKATR